MPMNWDAFRNYFWTAHLIGGTGLSLKLFVQTLRSEGLALAIGSAVAAFVLSMPLSAVVTAAFVWWQGRQPASRAPNRTRWCGAALLALIVSALIFGGAAIFGTT